MQEKTIAGNILLVDDLRTFNGDYPYALAKTVAEALELLEGETNYDYIFLDHDLGEGGDIFQVVGWLLTHGDYPVKTIYIHSSNPVGALRMLRALENSFDVELINPLMWS